MPFTYDDMKQGMAMKAAIKSDPTAEQILYVPARANPFDNVVFIKNALASGSIMPPRDGAEPDRLWPYFVAAFLTVSAVIVALWRFA